MLFNELAPEEPELPLEPDVPALPEEPDVPLVPDVVDVKEDPLITNDPVILKLPVKICKSSKPLPKLDDPLTLYAVIFVIDELTI